MRLAATRSSINFGSGGPAETGACCATTELAMHRMPTTAAANDTARSLRLNCSLLVMTNSKEETTETLTVRAQYPNRDSRASSRADSWAGIAGHSGADDELSAGMA